MYHEQSAAHADESPKSALMMLFARMAGSVANSLMRTLAAARELDAHCFVDKFC